MAEYTEHINLEMPGENDYVNIEVLNENYKKIDHEVGQLEQTLVNDITPSINQLKTDLSRKIELMNYNATITTDLFGQYSFYIESGVKSVILLNPVAYDATPGDAIYFTMEYNPSTQVCMGRVLKMSDASFLFSKSIQVSFNLLLIN